jgi:hypothetical protein
LSFHRPRLIQAKWNVARGEEVRRGERPNMFKPGDDEFPVSSTQGR